MTDHMATLKTAAQRPVRVAKFVLIIGGGLAVGGIALVVVVKVRQRAEARSPMGRLRALADAPKKAQDELERKRKDLRQNLRKTLKKELQDSRPLHEKLLTDFAQKAASTAIPIAIRKLEQMVTAGGSRSQTDRFRGSNSAMGPQEPADTHVS
jgi:hypothetical protein